MHTRVSPLVYIRNAAQPDLSDEEIERIIAAVQRQVTEHFQPAWGLGAQLVFARSKEDVPARAYQIVVYKTAEDAEDKDFLGYHYSPEGFPVANVFLDADLEEDKTISDTLSHEVLEMIVDPSCNLYAYRPSGVGRAERIYFYEVCDAVQSEHYDIDGVSVCDFVYPEWFENNWKAGSRKFDHLHLLDHPFHVLKGCYADIFEARRGSFTIWGKDTPEETQKKERKRRRLSARKGKMNFLDAGEAPNPQD
jgi:hypothetical protein